MGQEKPNRENLPSQEGLEIDWGCEPVNKIEKRANIRLTKKELTFLFRKNDIPVNLVTEKRHCTAFLVDVSQRGVCLRTKVSSCNDSQYVKIGLLLGNQKVISEGRVKHVRKEKDWDILGIEFIELTGDSN